MMQAAEKITESAGLPEQLQYLITATSAESAIPVAVAATPGIAFSVYYAAIGEHLGAEIRLTQGGRTLAASVH